MNQLWMAAFVYASALILLSESFYLMYRSTRVPNFAVGTISTFGAYAAYYTKVVLGLPAYLGYTVSLLVGCLLGLIVSVLLVEPLIRHGRNIVEMTLATMGLAILFEASIQIFDKYIQGVVHRYYSAVMLRQYDFMIGGIYGSFIVASVLAFASILFLVYVFRQTSFGVALTATWENTELAQIQGINPIDNRVKLWVLAGGLAGLAGGIMVMWFHVTAIYGSGIMMSVFTAVLLGGMGNLRGAFIGGLLVGLGEILLTTLGQSLFGVWFGEYRQIVPVIIMTFVLLLRPNGLFGTEQELTGVSGPLRQINKKLMLGLILFLIICGAAITHINNVNRMKKQDEIIAGFSNYTLTVMEMDPNVTRFNSGSLKEFKDLFSVLNITKVYVEPYSGSSSCLTFFFIKYEKYWYVHVSI